MLPREDSRLLESLAGLRNIIVHMYADIDYTVLAEVLDLLDELERIMGSMLGYIERKGLDP